MKEKYLPIGTIVLLKSGTKKLMITGFCVATQTNPDKVYDYCGCLYPEGVISSNQTLLFDHIQINQVFSEGYSDSEEKDFKIKLKEFLENSNKKVTNTSEITQPVSPVNKEPETINVAPQAVNIQDNQ